MDDNFKKLIEIFSFNKSLGLSDENAAGVVYHYLKDNELFFTCDDLYILPLGLAIALIPKFIGGA